MTEASRLPEPVAFNAAGLFDVQGRRALITGAAHGLGLAVATAFVGAGAKVGILDVDEPALKEAHTALSERGVTVARTADLRDDEAVSSAVDDIAEELGGIDILINDAAIVPSGTLSDIELSQLTNVLDVNLTGSVRTIKAALPYLKRGGHGRIINFGSVTFFLGYPDGLGAYIATKGAVVALTRALAREIGPAGVTANVLAPGAFPTRAEQGLYEDQEAFNNDVIARQSIKRRGAVDDIAAAALFLASDAASFITGQTLLVDGGWTFN